MSEDSIVWLKILMIVMVICPLMYVSTVFFVNSLFIIRNIKGFLRLALILIIGLIIAAFWVGIMFFALISGASPNQSENVRSAYIIWFLILYILTSSPSYWYLRKRWSDLEELGRSHPWNK